MVDWRGSAATSFGHTQAGFLETPDEAWFSGVLLAKTANALLKLRRAATASAEISQIGEELYRLIVVDGPGGCDESTHADPGLRFAAGQLVEVVGSRPSLLPLDTVAHLLRTLSLLAAPGLTPDLRLLQKLGDGSRLV